MPPRPKPLAAPYIPPMLARAEDFRCQPRAVGLVDRALQRGRLQGVLLFLGERGLGKTTLAAAIARALTCEENRGEGGTARQGFRYCGECYACRSIASGNQPEFTVIRPTRKEIGVIQLRGEQDNLSQAGLHPLHLSHRIFIFDEAHLLTEDLSNRLLKLLEEPPERSVFMLVTDKPHLLLPTIRSRGQLISLSPASTALLTQELAQDLPQVSTAALQEAARMSAGRYVQARGLAGAADWRSAVKAFAEALARGRSFGKESKDLAAFELAGAAGSGEGADEDLTPERQRELDRAALIAAYQRAAWWLCCEGRAKPGLLGALARLRGRIDSNVDPSLAQAAFEAEMWLGEPPLGLRQMLSLRA